MPRINSRTLATVFPKLLGCAALFHLASCTTVPTGDATPIIERIVPGTSLHGIQGLTWAPDGKLYSAAMSAQQISRIDPATGAVETLVDAPDGESDDVAVSSDGTIAWTAMAAGELRIKRLGGKVEVIARDLPGLNPIAFNREGRLFAATMGTPSRLWEFDLAGKAPPRLVTDKVQLLNGFVFGADNALYGPYWQIGKIARIDVNTGEAKIIAEGLGTPSAIDFDTHGQLISVDYNTGEVRRTNPLNGASSVIAQLAPPLDNLAVGPDDTIYVSDTARSGVIALKSDGTLKGHITGGEFSTPGGLASAIVDGRETIVVADSTGYRFVDPKDGKVTRPPFNSKFGTSINLAATGRMLALTDGRSGRVQAIDLETRELLFERIGLEAPYGVGVMTNGDILIAEYGTGNLLRWNKSATQIIAKGLRGPVGLAIEPTGSVLIAEHSVGTIARVNLATGHISSVFSGLDAPEGIAIMKDGSIAVAEVGARRVIALDLTHMKSTVLAENLTFGIAALRAPPRVGMMTGVAVTADGAIYVNEDKRGGITKITIPSEKPASLPTKNKK